MFHRSQPVLRDAQGSHSLAPSKAGQKAEAEECSADTWHHTHLQPLCGFTKVPRKSSPTPGTSGTLTKMGLPSPLISRYKYTAWLVASGDGQGVREKVITHALYFLQG